MIVCLFVGLSCELTVVCFQCVSAVTLRIMVFTSDIVKVKTNDGTFGPARFDIMPDEQKIARRKKKIKEKK